MRRKPGWGRSLDDAAGQPQVAWCKVISQGQGWGIADEQLRLEGPRRLRTRMGVGGGGIRYGKGRGWE